MFIAPYRYFEKSCPHPLASYKMIGSPLETILKKEVLRQTSKYSCSLTACCLSKWSDVQLHIPCICFSVSSYGHRRQSKELLGSPQALHPQAALCQVLSATCEEVLTGRISARIWCWPKEMSSTEHVEK